MRTETIIRPAPHKGWGPDHILMCDTDGFASIAKPHAGFGGSDRSWTGGLDYNGAVRALHDGYEKGVADSERFMDEFSGMDFSSRKFRTINAVSGGAPNIGAYLGGSPVCMRRRERLVSDTAPLHIFVDIVSSGGIDASDLKKRGAAALALARLLSAQRPVNVYAVGGLYSSGASNPNKSCAFIMCQLDNPLDLSRAAFAIAHPAMARHLMYVSAGQGAWCPKGTPHVSHWAYHSVDTYRTGAAAMYADLVQADVKDTIFLAPPFFDDPTIADPVAWIKQKLVEFGGERHDED